MKTITMLALAPVFAMTGVAHAQTFDGPSVGVQGGWEQTRLRNPTTDLGIATIDASKDDATIGGFVGYDKSFGKFVLGVEGGFSNGISDTVRGGTAASPIAVNPKWSFDATTRAGYLVTPQTLMYLRGGYANERVRTTLTSTAGTTTAKENRDGYLLGGGVERVIVPHLSARLEYRYTDLSEADGKFARHQTLLGFSYRF